MALCCRRKGAGAALLVACSAIVAVLSAPAFVAPSTNSERWSTDILGTQVRPGGRSLAALEARTWDTAAVAAASATGGDAFGSACRAVGAILCAFACSASRRSGGRQSIRVVARRSYPSMGHRPKQKVLRRYEAFGQIPAWSRRRLQKRRVVKPWRLRTTRMISSWGRNMIEKQRVRYHYNVKDKQLRKYMARAYRKGIEYPVDNFLQQLESRIDNFVWRVGLAPTMSGARKFVRDGHIQYLTGSMTEYKTLTIPSARLRIGDKVRVRWQKSSQNYGRLNHDDEGPVDPPPHIVWDREKMEGEYCDICHHEDVGLHVNEQMIIYWFSGQQAPLRRKHFRLKEGTMHVIKKGYRGGRTRPTPENLLNMKRGVGLNKRGRARPPCLWGRRYPLNSPYEVSAKKL